MQERSGREPEVPMLIAMRQLASLVDTMSEETKTLRAELISHVAEELISHVAEERRERQEDAQRHARRSLRCSPKKKTGRWDARVK